MRSVKEYEAEAAEDLRFDESDIHKYTMSLGRVKVKWLSYLHDEELKLSEAEGAVQVIWKQLHHKYRYESKLLIDKKDIEIYARGDSVYQEAKRIFEKQAQKVKFLTEMTKILDNQSFLISSCVKMILYRAGEQC